MTLINFTEEVKTIIGILVAIIGGAAIRLIDRYLSLRNGNKESDLRQELRREIDERNTEIDERNTEIDVLQKDLNKWKEKYWKEVSSHSETKTRLTLLHKEPTDGSDS